ncbi:Intraflagellar transport protein 57-like protein [Heterocephalus glaber]|uniref:Intraflagellar transport protein 57 homolog n=1 Tax=Heterocephalus glaber TaxID=10181 RepID=G5BVN3_HETGA|nr:Intraflagellar transport protein 57-like protein [Heterocephalus glaber]
MAYRMFVVMEDLVEKLKLLRFEEELLRKSNLKASSRHYFALPTNPAEEALKYIGFTRKKPAYPVEEVEEETVPEDDAELTLNKVARERYQQGSGGVTERTRLLAEVTEELEKVKQEMEEKGSSMTDGAPSVKIKQSLTKLKQETIQMDIRIGVVEHILLQSKLKKSNMTRDTYATIIPESTIG